MRRNRRDSIKKERIIMIASSAFVLAALTMTGLYMKGQEMAEQDDGYTLDLAALENDTEEKLDEIGQVAQKNDAVIGGKTNQTVEGELDYMPLEQELSAEVGSNLIQIPGLTDGATQEAPGEILSEELSPAEELEADQQANAEVAEQVEEAPEQTTEFHYSTEQGLTRPVSGEILLPYSMDGSIYFATLDQYKYNPATVFAAEEGSDVSACAAGRITEVFETAQLGKGVVVDLGDGYVATYGQLADIQVAEGDVVSAGEKIGVVAAPSKYYTLEGTNLYFCLEKDGAPINAENLF